MDNSYYYEIIYKLISGMNLPANNTSNLRIIADILDETSRRFEESNSSSETPKV